MTTALCARSTRLLKVLVPTVMLMGALAGVAHAAPVGVYTDAAGREWARLQETRGLSWNELHAVCPTSASYACTGNVIPGLSLTGWTWATRDLIRAVFIELAPVELGGGRLDDWIESKAGSSFAPTLVARFGPTGDFAGNRYAFGRTASMREGSSTLHVVADIVDNTGFFNDNVALVGGQRLDDRSDSVGAWLFRTPTTPVDPDPPTPGVPEPATLTLLGLGCAGVSVVRRRRRG